MTICTRTSKAPSNNFIFHKLLLSSIYAEKINLTSNIFVINFCQRGRFQLNSQTAISQIEEWSSQRNCALISSAVVDFLLPSNHFNGSQKRAPLKTGMEAFTGQRSYRNLDRRSLLAWEAMGNNFIAAGCASFSNAEAGKILPWAGDQ